MSSKNKTKVVTRDEFFARIESGEELPIYKTGTLNWWYYVSHRFFPVGTSRAKWVRAAEIAFETNTSLAHAVHLMSGVGGLCPCVDCVMDRK